MNKYEQLIEHIINDEEDKARALFHDIVVEKSRDIYESLMDEEYTEEDFGGDQVADLVDEVTADETDGIGEAEEAEEDEMMDLDMGDDMESDQEEMDNDEDLEQKVMDLESELDALKAEFEELMADEKEDSDHADMDDAEVEVDDMEQDRVAEAKHDDEDEKEDEKEDKDEKMSEAQKKGPMHKTAVDLMREYVEKISAPSNTEFSPVGTGAGGDKPAGNTANPVAGKNDMGGTSANMVKGGSESAPDGTSAPKKATVKDLPHSGQYENVPGAKAGNAFSKKEKAKSGEDSAVNKSSIETGGN